MIWSHQYLDVLPTNSTAFTTTYAARFTNGAVVQNAGNLTIAGKVAKMKSNGNYVYNYNDSNQLATGISLLGTTINVSTAGTASVPAISASVYVPKKLMTSPYFLRNTYDGSNANPITLTWTPDITTYNKIFIRISKEQYTTSPFQGQNVFTYLVNDNGSYALSNGFCFNWPNGTRFNIQFGRASETIVTSANGRKTYIYAVTEAATATFRYK